VRRWGAAAALQDFDCPLRRRRRIMAASIGGRLAQWDWGGVLVFFRRGQAVKRGQIGGRLAAGARRASSSDPVVVGGSGDAE